MSLATIAKHAGVSTATVSRVLNNVPSVDADIAEQVKASIKALEYNPERLRRGPRAGTLRNASRASVRTIAVITLGVNHDILKIPVFAATLQSISRSATEEGLRLMLAEMQDPTKLIPMIENQEVDGVIAFLRDNVSPDVLLKIKKYVPVVWVFGGQAGTLPTDHVAEDNITIGYMAFEYLHQRGCRNPAFFAPSSDYRFCQQRGHGFTDAGLRARCPVGGYTIAGDLGMERTFGGNVTCASSWAELVAAFANASPRHDGLFSMTDCVTAKLYPLLLQHGIKPDRDVAIISCDNEDVRLSALHPRPASIELGTQEIGVRVIRRLMLRIEHQDDPPVRILTMPRIVMH